jgi:tetratricopeptide (TPR) repeat protein
MDNNDIFELINDIIQVIVTWFSDNWDNIYFMIIAISLVIAYMVKLASEISTIIYNYYNYRKTKTLDQDIAEKFKDKNVLRDQEQVHFLSTYIRQSFETLYKMQSKEFSVKEIDAALFLLKKGEIEKADEIFEKLLNESCEQKDFSIASRTIQTIMSLLVLTGNQDDAISRYEEFAKEYPDIQEYLDQEIYNIAKNYAVIYGDDGLVENGGNIDLSRVAKDLFDWILMHLKEEPTAYVIFSTTAGIGVAPNKTDVKVPTGKCQIILEEDNDIIILAQYPKNDKEFQKCSRKYTYQDLLMARRVIAQHWLLNIEKLEKEKKN